MVDSAFELVGDSTGRRRPWICDFCSRTGPFLVAKACGVKCEKFFLGFDVGGLKILSFTWGETEYGIGALAAGRICQNAWAG